MEVSNAPLPVRRLSLAMSAVAVLALAPLRLPAADPGTTAGRYADVVGDREVTSPDETAAPGDLPADRPTDDSRYTVIYSNSGDPNDPFLVTRPGAGCSGRDASDVQSALGLTLHGFNCWAGAPNAVADDFVVPTGQTWTINELVFFLYQTNATAPTVTAVKLRLQTANPLGGPVPTLTTLAAAATFSNVYKILDTDPPGTVCNRRVQQCVVTLATPYQLAAGTYYLIWEGVGNDSFSGPWQPPVVIPGATHKPGANGMSGMHTTGLFQPALDAGHPQDFVFVFRGTITSTWSVGDLNCDGAVNFDDINPFVVALTGYDEYHAQYPNCNWMLADCNGDGAVSFDDINAFVVLLGGG